jgi:hypothetical protein
VRIWNNANYGTIKELDQRRLRDPVLERRRRGGDLPEIDAKNVRDVRPVFIVSTIVIGVVFSTRRVAHRKIQRINAPGKPHVEVHDCRFLYRGNAFPLSAPLIMGWACPLRLLTFAAATALPASPDREEGKRWVPV